MFGLSTELLTKGKLATVKRFQCWPFKCEPLAIHSDLGLTLETSALESIDGDQITFHNKPNIPFYRRSTAVSLETNFLIDRLRLVLDLLPWAH